MNLLFFDIECANCFQGQGKICSFGYVLCDLDFNIIKQEDILINPKSKFHLCDRTGTSGIELSYPQEAFISQPDFAFFYPTIQSMLENQDNICFGHSVINDLNFLNSECRRYNLPYINFKTFDSQMLYKLLTNATAESGLSKICTTYGITVTDLHRSDYDAYLTSRIVQKMCENSNMTIMELLDMYPKAYYDTQNGKVTNHNANINYSKRLHDFAKYIKPLDNAQDSKIFGLNFCFDKEFEKENFKKALFLVKNIKLFGGNYSNKQKNCNFMLKYNNTDIVQEQDMDKDNISDILESEANNNDVVQNLNNNAIVGNNHNNTSYTNLHDKDILDTNIQSNDQNHNTPIQYLNEKELCSLLNVDWEEYQNSELLSMSKLRAKPKSK